MTPTEPGRALDALVAEKVMGLIVERRMPPPRHAHAHGEPQTAEWYAAVPNLAVAGDPFFLLPRYSSDIADAWQVVERMREQGWGHKHQVYSGVADIPGVWWTFMKPGMAARSIVSVEAATVSHAVCLAALRAVGHE